MSKARRGEKTLTKESCPSAQDLGEPGHREQEEHGSDSVEQAAHHTSEGHESGIQACTTLSFFLLLLLLLLCIPQGALGNAKEHRKRHDDGCHRRREGGRLPTA